MCYQAEPFLKAIAESTRLRIVLLLQHYGELCVCDLQAVLELSQPKISRHLKTLRDEGLVQGRREGLWVHYSLHQQLPQWTLKILEELRQGNIRQEPYESDARKVKKNLSRKACKG